MLKGFIEAEEISQILGISLGMAKSRIRELNKELSEKGYKSERKKVLRKYFNERYGLNYKEDNK